MWFGKYTDIFAEGAFAGIATHFLFEQIAANLMLTSVSWLR